MINQLSLFSKPVSDDPAGGTPISFTTCGRARSPHSLQGLTRPAFSHDSSLQRQAVSNDQQFTAASVPSNQRPHEPASAATTFRCNQHQRQLASSATTTVHNDQRLATTSSSLRPAFPATSVHKNQRPPRSLSAVTSINGNPRLRSPATPRSPTSKTFAAAIS